MQSKYWFSKNYIRILLHVIFLVFSFYVLLNIFKTGNRPDKIDFIYTGLFMLILIPAIYINLELLIPRLARGTKWPWYALSLALIIIFFTWINLKFFQDWSSLLMPDWFFISYYTWWEIVLFFAAFIAITTLLKLSKSWFIVNDLNRQLLIAEKEKVQIELQALKAQINPHFFFNTLNGIYSMALDKDERLADTVLQLSGLMRYFLYDSKEELVPLKKELQMLQDYIALQKIRSADRLDVEESVETAEGDEKIAPLLLITFIENAFKHAPKSSTVNAFIKMKLLLHQKKLIFQIENNKGPVNENDTSLYSGLGLKNVKRRLELLYPRKHELEIHDTPDLFKVKLQLILE